VDSEFWISELTDDDVPAVVTLCRDALDLDEYAAEAAEIVLRLREKPEAESWAKSPRRLAGCAAAWPTSGPPARTPCRSAGSDRCRSTPA
jgi:hypothetical protein